MSGKKKSKGGYEGFKKNKTISRFQKLKGALGFRNKAQQKSFTEKQKLDVILARQKRLDKVEIVPQTW